MVEGVKHLNAHPQREIFPSGKFGVLHDTKIGLKSSSELIAEVHINITGRFS